MSQQELVSLYSLKSPTLSFIYIQHHLLAEYALLFSFYESLTVIPPKLTIQSTAANSHVTYGIACIHRRVILPICHSHIRHEVFAKHVPQALGNLYHDKWLLNHLTGYKDCYPVII